MSKQLTATVSDDADLALTSIEIACRKATGQPIRRPEAVEIAILVAARHPDETIARRAAALEQLQVFAGLLPPALGDRLGKPMG